MSMLKEVGFTEARRNLTSVIDEVQSAEPSIIKARKKSEQDTLLITKNLFAELLEYCQFGLDIYEEETGDFTAWLEPFDVYGMGQTREEAINDVVNEAIEYAKEFIEQRSVYLHAPNRKGHFPHVLRVLVCDTHAEVRDLLVGEQNA